MKKIFKVLKTIFILFLIAILLYVLYSKYIRKDRITKVFGYGFLVVLTGSMDYLQILKLQMNHLL